MGATYLIMYLFLFRKYEIKYGILYLIMVIILMPFLIFGSLNYYKDLYNGKIEFETESEKSVYSVFAVVMKCILTLSQIIRSTRHD